MAVSRKDYEEIKHSMGQKSAKEFVKASAEKKKMNRKMKRNTLKLEDNYVKGTEMINKYKKSI